MAVERALQLLYEPEYARVATEPSQPRSGRDRARSGRDAEGGARAVDRLLLWLLAPAGVLDAGAPEEAGAEQLSLALEFIQALTLALARARTLPLSIPIANPAARDIQAARRREARHSVDVLQGGWAAEEDEARVRWALAEAR